MELTIWKRSDRDVETIVNCPSDRAKDVFELYGGRVIGEISIPSCKYVKYMILMPSDERLAEAIRKLKELKERGIELENP